MTYTVLARRYRSAGFDQVIGQEPVARTLKNAIAGGRVAHAYLFTGTRGVGKTSMARILASALNAPDAIEDCPTPTDPDGYPEPEVQRRIADAVMRGDDLNVIEIDGASNRGVDEVRQLIANAGLSPTGNARYKVYIIDEVHMLTREAFNALLKTMEEPPPHVKFILCTTESQKVPATIQSRCQRFDFRLISTTHIAEHLAKVAKAEAVDADDQVLWRVARLGNGSMRDALTLLDRLIASAEPGDPTGKKSKSTKLTSQLLDDLLGLPPGELVCKVVDAIAAHRVGDALQETANLLDTGVSQEQLIDALVGQFRELMLIAACGEKSPLIELAGDDLAAAIQQSKNFDVPALVYMIAMGENVQRLARTSANPRALLDAAIARLALAEKMSDVTGLISQDNTATPAADEKKKDQAA